MIVATAGHIDHGKTALVRALTGVDTDSLPQEKARGITIDIGFAHWSAPDGTVLAFVDVPGHERYIHNMLAGVSAIDFALLVVAADDGVMPQTREHLAILELFGVSHGLVVITKIDRVPNARTHEVRTEISALLAGTALAAAPVVAVCAPQDIGLDEVREVLLKAAAQRVAQPREGRCFRMSIDRSFSLPGSGTVVTGTAVDGEVTLGDRLTISPSGVTVRVRGLHQRGRVVERVATGERCAINIVGADPRLACRGQWLVAPGAHGPTRRIDVELKLLNSEHKPLRHWDQLHVHLGTDDVVGRLVLPGASVAPGQIGMAQLLLDRVVSVVNGERFVLRDPSAIRTVGGGRVLDPHATHPRIQREARTLRLAALAEPDLHIALPMLLDANPQGLAMQPMRRTWNLTPVALGKLLAGVGAVQPLGEHGHAFSANAMQELRMALINSLRAFHAATPQAFGMDTDRLLRSALPKVPHRDALSVLRILSSSEMAPSEVEVRGSLVRLRAHAQVVRAGDEFIEGRLAPLLAAWGPNVPQLREVALRSELPEKQLRDYMKHRSISGEMVRLGPERYLLRDRVADLAQAVVSLSREHGGGRPTADGGEFTLGEYRDRVGVGRNLAIEVLEYFDRLGLTRRLGDARTIRCLDESIADGLRSPDWRPTRLTDAINAD